MFPAEVECGTLAVPIDHNNPSADSTLDLWVSRRKANGTAGSQGTFFFNNGGPGAASSTFWPYVTLGLPVFSQALLEAFDIIAIDPRGIGLSTPIQCDHELWNAAPKSFATDDESFAALVDWNKKFSASCAERTGPLFNFFDTVSTVKDYDLVREVLGVDKIHFAGYSYGTLQGQVYAELYPERVGRFVLDGLTDHTVGGMSAIMTETLTYEVTLRQFFDWCDASTDCPLHGEPVEEYFVQLSTADELPAPSCNGTCLPTVRGEDVINAAQLALAWVDAPPLPSWADFASSIKAAIDGDASAFSVAIQTEDANRGSDSPFLNRATMCQDYGSSAESAADIKRIVDVASRLTPLTRGGGQAFAATAYCAGWGAPLSFPPRPLDAAKVAGLPPVLLVNAFYDPETSAAWAEGVRGQLPSAVNIWRNGSGHTSYLRNGKTARAMDAFLIEGTIPADGTTYDS
ncbi:alpha/beta-hydrolase [Thozetella sp. PMI_491]|nr:alpha/beta-hydrolase [Thozetella sp. PMI_491]